MRRDIDTCPDIIPAGRPSGKNEFEMDLVMKHGHKCIPDFLAAAKGRLNRRKLEAVALSTPMTHGKVTAFTGRAVDCLTRKKNPLLDDKEKYDIGKSIPTAGGLPEKCKLEDIRFGTVYNDFADMKKVLFPGYNEQEDYPPVQKSRQHLLGYTFYKPGEQKNRFYEWDAVPDDFRFGVSTHLVNHYTGEEAKKVMDWQYKETSVLPVTKRYEEFVQRNQPEVGKVHDSIAETMKLPSDHIFGVHTPKDRIPIQDIIYHSGEFKSNKSLNKRKHIAPKIGNKHAPLPPLKNSLPLQGIPTVRRDMDCPPVRRLADCQNYGDQLTVKHLIQPNPELIYYGLKE